MPADQHAAVLQFTHGHPLALVLVADVIASAGAGAVFNPENAPNVVRELLVRLIASVPTPRHRKALETCARVRVTTEALLGAVIDGDPHELFEWLCGLSFIEHGAEGLFPHDLAREVLDADFRWRDPDGSLELHRRVWRHLRQKLLSTTGRARQRAFFDKLYLHRASATGGQYHDYATLGTVYAQAVAARDRDVITDAVRRHEGDESARIAAHWLDRQPQAFRVARGPSDELLGFVASVTLRDPSAAGCGDRSRGPRGVGLRPPPRPPARGRRDGPSPVSHLVRSVSGNVADLQLALDAGDVRAARAHAGSRGASWRSPIRSGGRR